MVRFGVLFITILLTSACSKSDQPSIYGKWMMHRVVQDGKDVTEEHNSYHERFFVFNEDGTFVSDGRPYVKNTGKIVFDEGNQTLFIDSDVGPEDDSNWKVTLSRDTMKWQGDGTAWAERFQITHIRAE